MSAPISASAQNESRGSLTLDVVCVLTGLATLAMVTRLFVTFTILEVVVTALLNRFVTPEYLHCCVIFGLCV